MIDMNAEFFGGELTGQFRSPINEDELKKIGYRTHLIVEAHGKELPACIAVPLTWTPAEAHQAIKEKFGVNSQRKPGKRSI